ncbi:MAG: hypothetical protein DI585_00800 [Pseudomonas fluorescens]|nr:MAG: hypothetical protein DI585_00800 [Pseudomonas fluorescens]
MQISRDAIKATQRMQQRYGNRDGGGRYTRALVNELEGHTPSTTFTFHDDGTFELTPDAAPPDTPDK